jgi:putative photosynthetic complex assembly protein
VSDAATHTSPVPAIPLVFAIALICSALAVAIGARLSDVGTTHLDYTRPTATRDLLFEDASNGAVLVKDANSGQQIGEIVPGNDGFVRAVMRNLARERLIAGGTKTMPFTLTRWDNGRLTIADPATGQKMELVGFGASNEKAFAKFLPQGSNAQ